MTESSEPTRQERLLAGLVALLAAERDERLDHRIDERRSEVLLADAGLSISEIADVLGRSPEAVKSTVRRHRARTSTATRPPRETD
jgi:DNA-directed RNA polymerase specialized sigma24 family protein